MKRSKNGGQGLGLARSTMLGRIPNYLNSQRQIFYFFWSFKNYYFIFLEKNKKLYFLRIYVLKLYIIINFKHLFNKKKHLS